MFEYLYCLTVCLVRASSKSLKYLLNSNPTDQRCTSEFILRIVKLPVYLVTPIVFCGKHDQDILTLNA